MGYNPGTPTEVHRLKDGLYLMDSFRGDNVSYLINLETLTCTCPHFRERLAHTGGICKHLKTVLQKNISEDWVEKARLCSDGVLATLFVRYQSLDQPDICGAIRLVQEERRQFEKEQAALKELFQ